MPLANNLLCCIASELAIDMLLDLFETAAWALDTAWTNLQTILVRLGLALHVRFPFRFNATDLYQLADDNHNLPWQCHMHTRLDEEPSIEPKAYPHQYHYP